ncbi:MAG: DUF362 domain-containing protein [Acidobacteriota bacterium]
MDEKTVIAYSSTATAYPQIAPFHPHQHYPENLFSELGGESNLVYESVRACFQQAGLHAEYFDAPDWNPLGELLHPGETVLLKPNLVKESHPRDPQGWQYVLTHGSVIRAVADYVYKAIGSKGKIIIADAPQTDSAFAAIVRRLGLDTIKEFYQSKGLNFELIDLRREEWTNRDGVIVHRRALAENPYGNVAFDLAQASEFVDHSGAGNYYGADYDDREVNFHHTNGRHEYLIAGCAIKCDVIFSLPKLKTHKKAGITVSLKNLVGINGDKNWLPHHTEGHPAEGGDEHPNPDAKHKTERRLAAMLRRMSLAMPGVGTLTHRYARRIGKHIFGDTETVIRSGNWHGNDTIWRMCLDLNKLILYGNADGSLREGLAENRKRHYVLVDGIIAGEGSGPVNPDPINAGLIIFGLHPASVDAACAYLMGFDPERIPIVRQAFRCRHFPLAEWDWRDVQILSNHQAWNHRLPEIADAATLHFKPHFGWREHIERPPMIQVEAPQAETKNSSR